MVPRKRLLTQICQAGTGGKALNWIRAFLTDMKMFADNTKIWSRIGRLNDYIRTTGRLKPVTCLVRQMATIVFFLINARLCTLVITAGVQVSLYNTTE